MRHFLPFVFAVRLDAFYLNSIRCVYHPYCLIRIKPTTTCTSHQSALNPTCAACIASLKNSLQRSPFEVTVVVYLYSFFSAWHSLKIYSQSHLRAALLWKALKCALIFGYLPFASWAANPTPKQKQKSQRNVKPISSRKNEFTKFTRQQSTQFRFFSSVPLSLSPISSHTMYRALTHNPRVQ